MKREQAVTPKRRFRVGELVEVLCAEEILATLDEDGTVDGMPFMPEMFSFCGKRLRVASRADKTCDTINNSGGRRLFDTVHLAEARCTGADHGGCQAQCLLFWKEAWLRSVTNLLSDSEPVRPAGASCSLQRLVDLTKQPDTSDGDIRYRCQATELLRASHPLAWWDVRQYLRDVRCGNVTTREVLRAFIFFCFRKAVKLGVGYRLLIWSYNRFQATRGGTPFPFLQGTCDKAPHGTLDLRVSETVRVKSYNEILKTLTKRNRNYGLFFGPEMVPYCGKEYRVRSRVEKIIEERTGKMLRMARDCLILDGVVCGAKYSDQRLFCPRAIFPFWREIWLERIDGPEASKQLISGDGAPIQSSPP